MSKLIAEAWQNLMLHKTRSGLAMLGIIFGVASVICMLSISEVARQDVIGRMERLGLMNVIIDSVKPNQIRAREQNRSEESWIARYGITREDLDVLRENVPEIDAVLPLRVMLKDVKANRKLADIHVVGTTQDYPDVMDHRVRTGRFVTPVDERTGEAVCVLGYEAARELFPLTSPIDSVISIGGVHFKVVGVMERKGQTGSGDMLSNPDNTAYIPFATTFSRFGKLQVKRGEGAHEATELEVSRAVLRLSDRSLLERVAGVAKRLMETRHKKEDVEVTIPYALMQEQQKAERIFRWVMASLAAISLLVGGVGIMNIMLANMAERRQEIGLRRALGATQGDVVQLFLGESVVLCALGGALGVAVGAALAQLVGALAQWDVVYQPLSFPFALGVSLVTGLIFGTIPAMKAAQLDPVLALRVE